MKLNYGRTILVGFAFFLISVFWQAFENIVPLILSNKFNMNEGWSGAIMAIDNVLALFMLPLFGTLSDRTRTRLGRRTPYIIFGTIIAAVAFSFIGFIDNLLGFMAVLLAALIAMATFRSPAVALMPDITLKPLRSKGNAIINLMGAAGGGGVLILAIFFKTGESGKTDFGTYLITVCAIMAISLAVFLLTVREPKWAREMEEEAERLNINGEEENTPKNEGVKLSGERLVSLILILASVFLWYFGYNAVTTKYTVYAGNFLKIEYASTLLVAQAAAIISYIPVGMIASRIGRKKTILAGIVFLFTAFFCGSFMRAGTPEPVMMLLFALGGIGWATINVNSFPMVVELAKDADCGKYTGYYYTASMAAQTLTPVFSGFLMTWFGYWIYFPYATIFVGLAFVTMLLVKHGDSRPKAHKAQKAVEEVTD